MRDQLTWMSCKLHPYSLQRTRSPPGVRLPKRIRNTHPCNYYDPPKGKDTGVHFPFYVEEWYCEFSGHGDSIHKLIHAFPIGIRAQWNANSFVPLRSGFTLKLQIPFPSTITVWITTLYKQVSLTSDKTTGKCCLSLELKWHSILFILYFRTHHHHYHHVTPPDLPDPLLQPFSIVLRSR